MTIIWMNEHTEKPKLKEKFVPALGLITSPGEFKPSHVILHQALLLQRSLRSIHTMTTDKHQLTLANTPISR